MKVLIDFEESQEICKAFRARGHEAYSCDIQDCSGGHPEWHLKMDAFVALLSQQWDLIIMHPPCTYLSLSGNGTYADSKQRKDAAIYTRVIWDMATNMCSKVAMENQSFRFDLDN